MVRNLLMVASAACATTVVVVAGYALPHPSPPPGTESWYDIPPAVVVEMTDDVSLKRRLPVEPADVVEKT